MYFFVIKKPKFKPKKQQKRPIVNTNPWSTPKVTQPKNKNKKVATKGSPYPEVP